MPVCLCRSALLARLAVAAMASLGASAPAGAVIVLVVGRTVEYIDTRELISAKQSIGKLGEAQINNKCEPSGNHVGRLRRHSCRCQSP